MDALDKRVILFLAVNRVRIHHVTQSSAQFKMYDLFISEIFHLILSIHS